MTLLKKKKTFLLMRSPLSVRVIAATGNSTCLSGHVGATIRFKKKKKEEDY